MVWMKEIEFIYGRARIRIRDSNLAAYLGRIEAAGYVVNANRCKVNERWKDVLMIARARDFEEFFSGSARIREIYRQFPQVYVLREGEFLEVLGRLYAFYRGLKSDADGGVWAPEVWGLGLHPCWFSCLQ